MRSIQRGADYWHRQEKRAGIPVTRLCREHGVGESTYYKWMLKESDTAALKLMRPNSCGR